jgi:hypothetical protein
MGEISALLGVMSALLGVKPALLDVISVLLVPGCDISLTAWVKYQPYWG